MTDFIEDDQLALDILNGITEPDGREVMLKYFNINNRERIILTTKSIYKQRRLKDDWGDAEEIYHGLIIPKEKLVVDGKIIFKFKTFEERCMSMKNIISNLKEEGGVVCRNRLEDAVNAVFIDLPEKTGHATYGVYENGKLFLCKDIMPYLEEQVRVAQRCIIDVEPNKDNLEPYYKILDFWHPYEVYPIMGMSIMAPFALTLRKRGYLVPIIWHFAPQSHLGKSLTGEIFSNNLFSIYPVSGNTIDSSFRLLNVINSICGPITVNEVDKVDWNSLDDIIKEYPERYTAGARGRTDLSQTEFLSRAVLCLTSNRFKINNKTTLNRIFKIEFDVTKEGERGLKENTDKLLSFIAKMEPIGWSLVEEELKYINYDLEEFIVQIQEHTDNIRQNINFLDPRRPFSWGLIYEGLKCWERAAIKYGIDWKAPTYTDFAEKVVLPIETFTKNTGVTPIKDFIHWWEMWKVRNKKQIKYLSQTEAPVNIDTTIGEGEIWQTKTIVVNGLDFTGDVITEPILREYQKDREAKIDSLTDIGKSITSCMGINTDELVKRWNFNGKTVWGVFIPDDIFRKRSNLIT